MLEASEPNTIIGGATFLGVAGMVAMKAIEVWGRKKTKREAGPSGGDMPLRCQDHADRLTKIEVRLETLNVATDRRLASIDQKLERMEDKIDRVVGRDN